MKEMKLTTLDGPMFQLFSYNKLPLTHTGETSSKLKLLNGNSTKEEKNQRVKNGSELLDLLDLLSLLPPKNQRKFGSQDTSVKKISNPSKE